MSFHQEADGAESQVLHSVQQGWLAGVAADNASSVQCLFEVFLEEAELHPPLTFLQTVASLEQVGTGRCVALLECSG